MICDSDCRAKVTNGNRYRYPKEDKILNADPAAVAVLF